MENLLSTRISDNFKTLELEIDQETINLYQNMDILRDENEHLKAQISESKKENTQVEQIVMDLEAKIHKIESIIGV